MEQLKKTLDQMGAKAQASIDTLRAELRAHSKEVRGSIQKQQEAISDLQTSVERLSGAVTRTSHALLRQEHTLDQSLARVADDLNLHRENVGTAVFGYVEDVNALKIEVRGLSARVDALERGTSPAA